MERDGQIANVREKGELNHLYDADGSPVQIVTMGGGVWGRINWRRNLKHQVKRGYKKL